MKVPIRDLRHGLVVSTATTDGFRNPCRTGSECGSVLIIVLWVAFGLVSIALYFAHSMSFEARAAENRVVAIQADEAIEGAVCYLSNVLATTAHPGTLPDLLTYQYEAVPIGDATFWLIGRDTNDWQTGPDQMTFGLVDEASKLNINTATVEMLQTLPNMTPELAAAIVDWRDTDSDVTAGGAELETYSRLRPAYLCKNAPFETIDELRFVYGMNLGILFWEDANLNGVLDANENDAELLPPNDNRDGRLDAGILDYVTVYSREPNTTTNGSRKVSVGSRNQLTSLLQTNLSSARATQIMRQVGNARLRSPLELYVRGKMTMDEFAKVADSITTTNGTYIDGLINVNTASKAVLACIPGIGIDKASSVISYRLSNPEKLNTVAWLAEVLDQNSAIQSGRYVTVHSYQFLADIAAVGRHGRGYRRVKYIFDTSEGAPKVFYRQDLTHLGWALGRQTREQLLLAKEIQ